MPKELNTHVLDVLGPRRKEEKPNKEKQLNSKTQSKKFQTNKQTNIRTRRAPLSFILLVPNKQTQTNTNTRQQKQTNKQTKKKHNKQYNTQQKTTNANKPAKQTNKSNQQTFFFFADTEPPHCSEQARTQTKKQTKKQTNKSKQPKHQKQFHTENKPINNDTNK